MRYEYQHKTFTCTKCGITFEVYSDSPIARRTMCNDCLKLSYESEYKKLKEI